ncbi:helix-turn-helix domain-containing protein [Legionella fallonii]
MVYWKYRYISLYIVSINAAEIAKQVEVGRSTVYKLLQDTAE